MVNEVLLCQVLGIQGQVQSGHDCALVKLTVQWGQRDGKNPCSKHIHSAECAKCWEGNKRVFDRGWCWVTGFGVCCQESLGCHISVKLCRTGGTWLEDSSGMFHVEGTACAETWGGKSQDGKKCLWGSMTWTGESFTRWDWSGGQGVKGWGRNFGLIIIFLLPHCGLWDKVEPRPMAVEVLSPNHGTAGEFPGLNCYWRVLGGWVIWLALSLKISLWL